MGTAAQQHGPLDALRKLIDFNLAPENIRAFLRKLYYGNIRVKNPESAIARMSVDRGSFQGGELLPTFNATELVASLSEAERAQLRNHFFATLNATLQALPNLKGEFPEQFRE